MACALAWACVDSAITGGEGAVALDVRPSFQVDPSLFPAPPVDRIRVGVRRVSDGSQLASVDRAIDPSASEWVIDVTVNAPSPLDVVVDIELLAGPSVEWSGRSAVQRVRAGGVPPAIPIDVHRGPLANLDVTSLTLAGAPAQIVVGGQVTLSATPTLVAGSSATPVIYWVTSDASVATVTATGVTATLQALAVGTVDVFASAGPAYAEARVAVVSVAPPGFDVQWVGGTTDWATGSNWSTGAVPAPGDDVYVPATVVQPTLAGIGAVGGLTLATGATLTLGPGALLGVAGDLDAGQTIAGSGTVEMTGAGVGLRGTITTPLTIRGSVSATAATTLADVIVSGSGASLDAGGQSISIAGDLGLAAGGVLIMQNPAADVSVAGSADFSGGSTLGLLTAGTLRVAGNFVVTDVDNHAFAASGTHTVVLGASLARDFGFDIPGAALQRFHNVIFEQGGLARATSSFAVTGMLSVAAGTTVDASGHEASVGGSLVDPAGGLSVGALRLIGAVSALPGALATDVFVDADVGWPVTGNVTGDLGVAATLDLASSDLSVGGDATVQGTLRVPTGRTLSVAGTLTLDPGSVLDVDGTVTVGVACVDAGATILGSGIHPCLPPVAAGKVWIGGASGAPTDWSNAANWQPVGVPTASDSVTVDVASGGPVLSANATVRRLIVGSTSTLDLAGFTLTVTTEARSDGTIIGGFVDITGAGGLLQGSFDDLRISSSRTPTGPVSTSGDLVLNNADFDVGGLAHQVGGALLVTGASAQLVMTSAGGALSVTGDATFDGGSAAGWLTAGTLALGGDLTVATSSTGTAFVGTGNHLTVLDGAGPQTVTFFNPNPGQQSFNDLTVSNTSGPVTFASDVVVSGDALFAAGSSVSATGIVVYAGGSFIDQSGTATPLELNAIGDLTAISSPLPADLRVSSPLTLPNDLVVQGDVRLANTDLSVGAFTLTVRDSLTVRGASAQLVMFGATGVLDVNGHALFDGGVQAGWLTQGTLRVAGDFTVLSGSTSQAFVASGTHSTVFDGAGAQRVSFSNPGITQQRFQHLTVANTGGTVTLATAVAATGDVSFAVGSDVDAPGFAISAGGSFVDASGIALFQELVVTGDLTAISSPLPADMLVTVPLNVPNDLVVQGDVRLANTDLAVGAFTLGVRDSLTVRGASAQLVMLGTGVVDVDGHAVFDGGAQSGWLTQGTLRVAGDFTVLSGSTSQAFVGTGTHTTVLDGAGPQRVSFTNPGIGQQRFHHLSVANTAGTVTFASAMAATGDVSFVAGSDVDAPGQSFSVSGSFVDASGVALFQELVVTGDLTAISSPLPADMLVTAPLNVPNDLVVQGDVRVSNSDLAAGAFTLTVADSLTVRGSAAQLIMLGAGVVDVNGHAVFDGGSQSGWLTQGTLRVAGDFTVLSSFTTQAFVGTIAHTTVFDGAGPQTISFSNPGPSVQRLHHLSVSNTSGTVTFTSSFVATGDVGFDALSDVDAPGLTFSVAGSYVDASGAALFQELNAIGDLSAISSPLPADLRVSSPLNLPNALVVQGDVRLDNSDLGVGNFALTVADSLTVRGSAAQLIMLGANGSVDVNGHAVFDGGSQSGWLTQGTLRVAGDFTVLSSSTTQAFVGTIAHTTILDGTGAQTVSFSNPGTGTQRLHHLSVENTTGTVTLVSALVATGDVFFLAGSDVDAPGLTFTVGASFVDASGAAVFQELNAIGDLTAISSPLPADLRVSATLNLPASLVVQGDVRLDNADLGVGAFLLTVADSLTVRGAGAQLLMLNANAVVDVNGHAVFDGGTLSGWMTAGTLRIAGDLIAGSTSSAQSFVTSGSHTTFLDGFGTQVVRLTSPGTALQRFQNLTVENFSGVVTVDATVPVIGTFVAADVALARSGPLGTAIDVRGIVNVDVASFDGLPLRVTSNAAVTSHTLDGLTFSNMDPADVQLFLQMPGVVGAVLTVNNAVFDTPAGGFNGGVYVETQRLSGTQTFTALFVNPTPSPLVPVTQGPNTLIQ